MATPKGTSIGLYLYDNATFGDLPVSSSRGYWALLLTIVPVVSWCIFIPPACRKNELPKWAPARRSVSVHLSLLKEFFSRTQEVLCTTYLTLTLSLPETEQIQWEIRYLLWRKLEHDWQTKQKITALLFTAIRALNTKRLLQFFSVFSVCPCEEITLKSVDNCHGMHTECKSLYLWTELSKSCILGQDKHQLRSG